MPLISLTGREKLDLENDDSFAQYCRRVTDVCPFLGPSAKEGATHFRRGKIDDTDLEKCQAELFYLLVAETEYFRRLRREAHSSRRQILLCLNILFEVAEELDDRGSELLGWPHYLAKLLYTDQGILFGKFYKGERELGRTGDLLPVPPVHFWSIRSSVENLDRRFFEKTPELLGLHINGVDNQLNVHAQHGLGIKNLNILRMRELNYYEKVLNWGRQRLGSA